MKRNTLLSFLQEVPQEKFLIQSAIEMQKIPVTIRDLNVLLTAELSVSAPLASAIAGKLNSAVTGVDAHSAGMVRWYAEEDVIFFDYSVGSRKYAAVLFFLYDLPELSGRSQLRILRMLKKYAGFCNYEDIQCMLIIPDRLLEAEPDLSGYPVVLSWKDLENILHRYGGAGGEYLARMLQNAADTPAIDWFKNGLVLN